MCCFLQVYDDSVEIQKHFMIVRDNVCRNGEGLGFSSPAISYTHRHLLKSVEEQTVRKRQAEEMPADDDTDQKKKVIIFPFGPCLLVSRFWLHTIGNLNFSLAVPFSMRVNFYAIIGNPSP